MSDKFSEHINSEKSYKITREGWDIISNLFKDGMPKTEGIRRLNPKECYYLRFDAIDIIEHPELCKYLEEIPHDIEKELNTRDYLIQLENIQNG